MLLGGCKFASVDLFEPIETETPADLAMRREEERVTRPAHDADAFGSVLAFLLPSPHPADVLDRWGQIDPPTRPRTHLQRCRVILPASMGVARTPRDADAHIRRHLVRAFRVCPSYERGATTDLPRGADTETAIGFLRRRTERDTIQMVFATAWVLQRALVMDMKLAFLDELWGEKGTFSKIVNASFRDRFGIRSPGQKSDDAREKYRQKRELRAEFCCRQT